MTPNDASQKPKRSMVPLPGPCHEAVHRGLDDVPFVKTADGGELQLLQVDLNQGFWVVRIRFPAGQAQTEKSFSRFLSDRIRVPYPSTT